MTRRSAACLLAAALAALATQASACGPAQSTATPPPAPTAATGTPVVAARSGGINVEPSMRPWRYLGPNPDSWWCRVPDCAQNPDPMVTIDTELTRAADLHVSVVRIEFPWYLLEPARGRYDFARADAIVAAARAHGVALQPVLVHTPSWAATSPSGPPAPADWSSFVRTMVARYHGSIRFWEMWNEPDLNTYWQGTEQDYVRDVLVPGHAAARAADPGAQVVLGGPSSPSVAWLDAIYTLGGGTSFEVMAFHDYSWDTTVLNDARTVRGVLDRHGQGDKPLWLGEYGYQEAGPHDRTQQHFMTTVLTAASPLTMAIWYALRDDEAMTCCPASVVKTGLWGLVQRDDRTLKDGYATMRSLLTGRVQPS